MTCLLAELGENPLPSIFRAPPTDAWGINSRGEIMVGYCFGHCDPFRIIEHHGFELLAGLFTSIDVPGALFTRPFAISLRGDIVGEYRDLDGQEPWVSDQQRRGRGKSQRQRLSSRSWCALRGGSWEETH
jgi:hypothetical protein